MQARQTFSVKFYCRKGKAAKNGAASIEMSIIVNGERVFVTLPRKMKPEDFQKQTSMRGNNETKQFLSLFETKVNQSVSEDALFSIAFLISLAIFSG